MDAGAQALVGQHAGLGQPLGRESDRDLLGHHHQPELGQRVAQHDQRAQAAGLVNTVVADDALDAAVADAVHTLRRAAPGAVAATKQLLRRLRATAPDLRDEAAIAFAAGLRSPEAAAGLAAFARKQPAPWAKEPGL